MKKLVATLLVLVSLLIGVVFALPLLLSSEAIRQEFSNRISAVSGMNITLGGPVNFSVFPDIGLVAKEVALASPDGKFLISVSKIVSSVKLSSVLSDQIEITGLSLAKPEITIMATDQKPKAKKTDDNFDKGNASFDPLAAAIEQLDRLSVKNFSIINGTFISRYLNGTSSIVTNINAELNAPSLDEQLNLVASATKDSHNISLTASISALRSILQRQPSRFELAIKSDPAPHPALANLTASGNVLLSEDGSYEITDGLFTSLGQPLRLDVLFRPGERPYGAFNLEAKRVDLGTVPKTSAPKVKITKETQRGNMVLDLGSLVDFDADVTVKIDSFTMDDIEVRAISLDATLENGVLDVSLGNAMIAKGSVATKLSMDINESQPTVRGSVDASALKISDLARLANMNTPITGNLGLDLSYAFSGLDENLIKKTFNLAGGVSISNGSIIVPALEGLGQSAKTISDLNFAAKISHMQKPVDINGKMTWNGESITFDAVVAPYDFISKNAGPLTLSFSSRKLNADYSGNIDLDGSAAGQLKFSTKSLENLMAWIGQDGNAGLRAFSYDGRISVDANSFAFDKASFALNGVKGTGSGSLDMYGKPSFISDLSFSELDITAILDGDAKTASRNGNNDSQSDSVPIDLSALKSFDANIRLKARKVLYGKVVGGPVNTTLIVKDGIARIALPQTPLYDGSIMADINADGSGDTPAIDIEAKLTDISALPFFGDAADFKRIEGKLNARLNIKGLGKTTGLFAKSLVGSSSARFTDGAIRGVNVAKLYNNLSAIMAGGFRENQDEKTRFTQFDLSFVIDKGVATTSDVKLLGPLVRMDGAGKVDLGKEFIDMRLNPLVVFSADGQGGEFDLGGIGIPVLIKGPLNNPRVYPDLAGILKNPQAAIDLISKLGLNIGKLGEVSNEPAKNIIGNLISKIKPQEDTGKIGGGENLINSMIGQLVKKDNLQPEKNEENQFLRDNQATNKSIDTVIIGGIPIPTPNPRAQVTTDTNPKPVKQQIVDHVVPKLNLPIDDESAKKTLDSLFENILQ